jgi:hypothetical protein
LLTTATVQAGITLTSDTETATAGYYQLTWQAADATSFELQEAGSENFADTHTIYNGPDLASVLSGRRNGNYYYRIRTVAQDGSHGPWSNIVKVTVQHHSLRRAFMFFTAGAIVFLAILGSIIYGSRKPQD